MLRRVWSKCGPGIRVCGVGMGTITVACLPPPQFGAHPTYMRGNMFAYLLISIRSFILNFHVYTISVLFYTNTTQYNYVCVDRKINSTSQKCQSQTKYLLYSAIHHLARARDTPSFVRCVAYIYHDDRHRVAFRNSYRTLPHI